MVPRSSPRFDSPSSQLGLDHDLVQQQQHELLPPKWTATSHRIDASDAVKSWKAKDRPGPGKWLGGFERRIGFLSPGNRELTRDLEWGRGSLSETKLFICYSERKREKFNWNKWICQFIFHVAKSDFKMKLGAYEISHWRGSKIILLGIW